MILSIKGETMTKHLFPIGLIYVLIIGSGMFMKSKIDLNKQYEQTINAMNVAININDDLSKTKEISMSSINLLIEENKRLKNELKLHQDVKAIVKDIHRIAE